MNIKMARSLYLLMISIFCVFSFSPPVFAKTNDEANIKAKNEVVYANLTAQGETENVYVVNSFDVIKAGKLIDYGSYEAVKNLTNVTPIEQQGDKVVTEVEAGTFYYQGDLSSAELPWKIEITYYLNGEEIAPEALQGQSGKVEIRIDISENKQSNPSFFANYMLQVTLPFAKERFTNITAEDATFTNVGKEQQVTFTTLPNEASTFSVSADVNDFAFSGIQIAGVPFTFMFDEFDFSEMDEEMASLSDAIRTLHEGVGDLHAGVGDLNTGTQKLRQGSHEFHQGIRTVATSAQQLVAGSAEVNRALQAIDNELENNSPDVDWSDLTELEAGIRQLITALENLRNGLQTFQAGYREAWQYLDEALAAMPETVISEAKWAELYQKGVDPQLINDLAKMYEASLKAKGTYQQTREVFASVPLLLTETENGITQMVHHIAAMNRELQVSLQALDASEDLEQLMAGLRQLSKEYRTFHNGLVAYTDGVSQLASAYGELDRGVQELTGGTRELATGTGQLYDGTLTLYDETKNMPEQVRKRIDKLLEQYDTSDFTPESFVAKENQHVELVQFVLQTEAIEAAQEEVLEEPKKETKGFWQLLKDLFTFN